MRAAAIISVRMLGLPRPDEAVAAAVNLYDATVRGGLDLGVLTGRAARGTSWVALDRFLAQLP
jgi:hypothetical protein